MKRDAIQEAASRIVVKYNAKRCFGLDPAFIQNTTVYLGAAAHRSIVIERDEGLVLLAEIKRLAAGILKGSHWPPTPSPLCEWCPFFGNGCSLDAQEDGKSDIDDWQEGAAD
jgi:hypothetical protein